MTQSAPKGKCLHPEGGSILHDTYLTVVLTLQLETTTPSIHSAGGDSWSGCVMCTQKADLLKRNSGHVAHRLCRQFHQMWQDLSQQHRCFAAAAIPEHAAIPEQASANINTLFLPVAYLQCHLGLPFKSQRSSEHCASPCSVLIPLF